MNRTIVGRCPMCLGQVELAQPHVQIRNQWRVVDVYHASLICVSYAQPREGEEVVWHYPARQEAVA
jgi:hypothetical protein